MLSPVNVLLCSEEEVQDLLLSLDSTKANGPDGISATMLKAIYCLFYRKQFVFLQLFNRSIQLGALLEEQKLSAVSPIPKSGAKDTPRNDRPISLLSILSKLLERHIHSLILGHLQSVSPVASEQWGFRSKPSTVSTSLEIINNWQQTHDNYKEICAVF